MATRSKQARKAATAAAATTSPWVQRLAEDEELRDNFRVAFEAAKDAYERVTDSKHPRDAVHDKKVQKDIKQAADALKDAGSALKEGPKKPGRKKGGVGRLLLVLIVGAAAALVASEELRTKVLDALFGKEEEFDYGSTAPSSDPGEAS